MTTTFANASLDQISSFNPLDWGLVVILTWSVVLAFARGIIRELFGLAGTVLGLFLAAWNYNALAAWLARWITSAVAAELTAFTVIALGVLVACTLVGRLLRGTAHTIGLGLFDRLAGAGFGLLRGALVCTGLLMTVTAFFPPQPLVSRSQLAPYFLAAAREVCFVVPQDLQKRITGGIDSIRHLAHR